MTVYTGSDLQKKIGDVLSDVQTLGWVKIKNRNRPDMVIITQSEFDEIMSKNGDAHKQLEIE